MSLIKCPECSGTVSDKAKACIHCGYPLADLLTQKNIAEVPCDPVPKLTEDYPLYTERALESCGFKINIEKTEKHCDKERTIITFRVDDTIQLDSLVPVIKYLENDKLKMLICRCNTFNENGNQQYIRYKNADDIWNFKNEPSPYATFSIEFGDRDTGKYRFSLATGINLKYINYIVNKEKLCRA